MILKIITRPIVSILSRLSGARAEALGYINRFKNL